MLKALLVILAFPAQALPQSEAILCGDGNEVTPSPLHSVLPHCEPAPLPQSKRRVPNA